MGEYHQLEAIIRTLALSFGEYELHIFWYSSVTDKIDKAGTIVYALDIYIYICLYIFSGFRCIRNYFVIAAQ